MEQRINIVELLKDYPSGMELDCTIFNDNVTVIFDGVDEVNENQLIKIIVICNNVRTSYGLTKYGQWIPVNHAKCVIFPKGKTTWEGFHRPFKDGDVIANNTYVAIFHKLDKIPNGVRNDVVYYHCLYRKENGYSKFKIDFGIGYESNFRFATDKEKQVLFNVIKTNGYKWNTETKTLEKLELAPNKFDINTLKPFESKVLVRSSYSDIWRPAIYGFTDSEKHYVVGGNYWIQCVPYEVNKELLGTTNNPE